MASGAAHFDGTTGPRGSGGIVTVLVADDSSELRQALVEFIQAEPSLQVVGVAADADQAAVLARTSQPDVALVDVRMPGGGGPRATREILKVSPRSVVVALSAYRDRESVFEMLRAGASGYLVKGTMVEDLVEAIRRVARGQGVLSADVTAEVVTGVVDDLEREGRLNEEHRARAERIGAALEGHELSVVFQPIFDLRDGRIVGLEALSRFGGDPPRGPEAWFRDAESVGLRVDLELAAISAALTQMDGIPSGAYLSVNMSPETAVSPQFLGDTLPAMPADRIVVEVTEQAPLENYGHIDDALRRLRDRGGRLAVDDAGAGFANLRRIVRLSPELIKLDVSLVRDIDTDRARRALAAALISFATKIDAAIVAEGVENEAVLETLGELGVVYAQGYHLARPAPLPGVPA